MAVTINTTAAGSGYTSLSTITVGSSSNIVSSSLQNTNDVLDITASQPVSAGPVALVSIQCIVGAAIALTLYDNRVNSGAVLFTQTMSAGDQVTFPTPINCINSLFASFTGIATFRFTLRSL